MTKHTPPTRTSSTLTRIALIQTNSADDIAKNIAHAQPMMQDAVRQGATTLFLPENAFYMRKEGTHQGEVFSMHTHPGVQFVQDFAKAHGVFVIIGSIRAAAEGVQTHKTYNRLVAVDAAGNIAAHYDKIHLFDATLPNGKSYQESAQFLAGNTPKMVEIPDLGPLGLSICYDLRFPHLYRDLCLQGAQMLTVPSAFTPETGRAHWDVLLRARAVENGAFVFAPAQCGAHGGGRETYGHSMVVDPWGTVLAEAGEKPEIVLVDIDAQAVHAVRTRMPVLEHHRPFVKA